MYLGTTRQTYRVHGTRYVVGIGDIPCSLGVATRELERYGCEHCGHVHEVLGKATEPFYCSRCVVRLVGIDRPRLHLGDVVAIRDDGEWSRGWTLQEAQQTRQGLVYRCTRGQTPDLETYYTEPDCVIPDTMAAAAVA